MNKHLQNGTSETEVTFNIIVSNGGEQF